jgi:hypothetical protein
VFVATELAGVLVISYMLLPYTAVAGAIGGALLARHDRREIIDGSGTESAFKGLPEMILTNYKFSDDFSVLHVASCECN